MLIKFQCPSCRGRLEADTSLSGTQSACPHCGLAVAIPGARIGPGTTIGGFKLERLLGKGGMGEVYLGMQLSMERKVAVKILPPNFAEDESAVRRFLHEVRIAARLDHPNIVTAHEAGEEEGYYFMAMAFVDGMPLDTRLKIDEFVPEEEALRITRTIADALAYAWDEHQLLHRDIKPANIIIDHRGRPQLMDMGLAKSLSEDSGLTVSGTVLGTPHYMSPEQAQGKQDIDVRADMYSLGATLYHLVTGTPPFSGPSPVNVLTKHLTEPFPPPRERNPRVSVPCAHLLEVMMAKRPDDRHTTWRKLIEDIDAVLAGRMPVRPLPGSPARAPAPAAPLLPGQGKPTRKKMIDLAKRASVVLAHQHEHQPPQPEQTPQPAITLEVEMEESAESTEGRKKRRFLTKKRLLIFVVACVLLRALLGGRSSSPPENSNRPPRDESAQDSQEPTPPPPNKPPDSPDHKQQPADGKAGTGAKRPLRGQPWTVPGMELELVPVPAGRFRVGG